MAEAQPGVTLSPPPRSDHLDYQDSGDREIGDRRLGVNIPSIRVHKHRLGVWEGLLGGRYL